MPWEPLLTRVETVGAEAKTIAWLGLDASAGRGELRLEGLTPDKLLALQLAEQLGTTPGWRQVVLSRFSAAETGPGRPALRDQGSRGDRRWLVNRRALRQGSGVARLAGLQRWCWPSALVLGQRWDAQAAALQAEARELRAKARLRRCPHGGRSACSSGRLRCRRQRPPAAPGRPAGTRHPPGPQRRAHRAPPFRQRGPGAAARDDAGDGSYAQVRRFIGAALEHDRR
jgi:hypothetical protein